jgi:hypothetical protein
MRIQVERIALRAGVVAALFVSRDRRNEIGMPLNATLLEFGRDVTGSPLGLARHFERHRQFFVRRRRVPLEPFVPSDFLFVPSLGFADRSL